MVMVFSCRPELPTVTLCQGQGHRNEQSICATHKSTIMSSFECHSLNIVRDFLKNFNRHNSHGHHGSKCCELVQHAHSHGSHAFTHTLLHQHSYNHVVWSASLAFIFQCMLGLNPPNSDMDYRIFNMRTWSFLCVHIHTGVGHTDSQSAEHVLIRKTHNLNFSCAPDGIRTFVLWIWSPMLYQLSYSVNPKIHKRLKKNTF